MTASLDALQLDQLWDAALHGLPVPQPIGDLGAIQLLELLTHTTRPAPPAAFVASLEEGLGLASAAAPSPAGAELPRPTPGQRTAEPARSCWKPPQSRWVTSGYAVAAVVVVLLLSAFTVIRQLDPFEDDRAIPAAGDWTGDGPPSSLNLVPSVWFATTWPTEWLEGFSFSDWSWIGFDEGTVAAGAHSEGLNGVDAAWFPGISVVLVQDGQLAFRLSATAQVLTGKPGTDDLHAVTPSTEVTIGPGESIVYSVASFEEVWNPTDQEADYVAGGLYTRAVYPLGFPGPASHVASTGISFGDDFLAETSDVSFDLQTLVIEPGKRYAYSIGPQTLLLANIQGDGLVLQAWENGTAREKPKTLFESRYALHQSGAGYYTLTNTGSEPVQISLFRATASKSPLPASVVATDRSWSAGGSAFAEPQASVSQSPMSAVREHLPVGAITRHRPSGGS